jgi:hypothetical protein
MNGSAFKSSFYGDLIILVTPISANLLLNRSTLSIYIMIYEHEQIFSLGKSFKLSW